MKRAAIQGRRAFVASLAASALVLGVVGALAYACSGTPSENTSVSPNTGKAGASLTVQSYTYGTSLAYPQSGFYFRYAYPGDALACPQETSIGVSESTNANHDIGSFSSQYSRTISNLGSVAGTGEACWSVTGSTNLTMISAPTPITVN